MYRDHFIVCGLGSLGQHCAMSLRKLGAQVVAITESPPQRWEVTDPHKQLLGLVEGDCSDPDVLARAGVTDCRGLLLVTGDDQINIKAAVKARGENPAARLVVRSGQLNLNRLLAEKLGNFTAFAPNQISANAFALAALGSNTVGLFQYHEHWLSVIDKTVDEDDQWALDLPLSSVNNQHRQVLQHEKAGATTAARTFHNWDPEARIKAGDHLIYLEPVTANKANAQAARQRLAWFFKRLLNPVHWYKRWRHFWKRTEQRQSIRVGLIVFLTVLFLLLSGAVLFDIFYPGAAFHADLFAVAVLLLGGYGDMFGTFEETPAPDWLQAYGLFLSLVGIALVGVIYGLVTEFLLHSKFQFMIRRPPVPLKDHMVVIGINDLGKSVADTLQRLRRPVACIATDSDGDRSILPDLPLLFGKPEELLERANIKTARSVIVTIENEIRSLEISLMIRAINPDCQLVVSAKQSLLGGNLNALLPCAEMICGYSVTADVLAGAAFGESIQGSFQLRGKTILISEFTLPEGDAFCGRPLGELAHELHVVAVSLSRAESANRLFPSEKTVLEAGDKLAVLATTASLYHIDNSEVRQLSQHA
jgi:Trk K+ transport system NAD-binding subunit